MKSNKNQKDESSKISRLAVCDSYLQDLKGLDPEEKARVSRIVDEFSEGFKMVKKYPKSVSILGSARTKEDNIHYDQARQLAKRIVEELDYAIITGGGYGIMEAGNRGAHEAGGDSIGYLIDLPKEPTKNAYMTDGMKFYYFFSRKVALAFSAEAYVFFPGGYGTLNELSEILMLIQTGKMEKVPVILFGKDFWKPFDDFIRKDVLEKHQAIDKGDMDIYTITDNVEDAVNLIKGAPIKLKD